MTIQKQIEFIPLDINGKQTTLSKKLILNVSEIYGNYLLYKDLLRQFQSKRQNNSSTKTRGEVRGGGSKPWRQKGTGRARAGSNSSPLWKGGGVIFGPKPRKLKLKLNKKERLLSLQTLLYNRKNKILFIEKLENIFKEPKTKKFVKICKNCNINLNQKILLVVSKKTQSLKLATQNLKNVELISVLHLNTLSILKAKQIIITSLAANYIKEI
uniref:Large ribosomal subunit protein uL4c n=1 Tax=Climaconeis cf. scalaris TaxID=2846828 RepID=A0A8F8X8A2_9STRA|nr:ribosomal protein L4 [Climaconeis cf. scalaris]QYB19175.1 ribosomal protein L4 [Climaconeis cf. scalaris]